MKKLTILMICFIALGALSSSALAVKTYSDEDVAKIIANAPGAEQYPQAGAIVLLHQKWIQYQADSSSITDEHLVVKFLQDRARRTYGDIKRRFNIKGDSIVVLKAVTYLADGTIQEVEQKAINDITPAALANASAYANIMQKVISFPGIAPGVTTELKLRTYSKTPDEEEDEDKDEDKDENEELFIWGTQLFQSNEPIFYKELSVTVPTGIQIRYTVQNEGLEYQTTESEGMVNHTWYVEHSPQIIEEPYMPRMSKIAPRLIYTNADSWDRIGDWVGEKFYAHVQSDGKIKKKAKKLIKGAATTKEKIEKIALYVITEIRDVGEWSLPLGLAGYEPHDAEEVLVNKYGDWRDKSVLLVSLLEAAGIESYPVFVHTGEPVLAEEHPALKQFNAIFVYLPDYNGQPLWINTFADHCYLGYFPRGQGSKVLLVKRDGCEILTALDTPAEANTARSNFEIHVAPDGNVEGSIACQLTGYFDWRTRSRLKNETPKELEQYFQKSANAIGEGGLTVEHKVTDLSNLLEPVKVAQSFNTPELGVVEGDMMIFHAPEIPFSFASSPIALGQTMRNYDVELESDLVIETRGLIYLPKGYKAVFVAEPFSVENDFGSWSSEYKLNDQGNAIQYVSTVRLIDTTIDTDEYFEFKQTFDQYAKPQNSLILLQLE